MEYKVINKKTEKKHVLKRGDFVKNKCHNAYGIVTRTIGEDLCLEVVTLNGHHYHYDCTDEWVDYWDYTPDRVEIYNKEE